MAGALDGIRVVDQTQVMAGPFASMLLADMGADVIKVEPPEGEHARHVGLEIAPGVGASFLAVNRGKKGMTLDLKQPDGVAVLKRLVATADVLVENYRPGVAARLGVDYDTLAAVNRRLIYCSVSGFGQDGPYRDRAALDLILQAESGMISVTGEEGGRGVRAGTSIADMTAGMYAAFGIMLALRVKERTGRGQAIDVSMLEGQMSLLGTMIGGFLADGELPAPMGTAYKALLPYQTFRTRTRDLALAVGSEKLWQIF